MKRYVLFVLLGMGTACELAEINVPPTEPIVTVQAVMRPDLDYQWVLVEQTLTGRTTDQGSVDIVPSDQILQSPVGNARVFVSNINLATDPCGPVTEFNQTSPPPNEQAQTGVYWSPQGCPTMRAGDTLVLRVEALDSVVSGRTEIPGFTSATLRAGESSVTTPLAQLEFNRDTDTLDASVQATHGRAIHVELHPAQLLGVDSTNQIRDTGSWFWVDSTGMTLPGDLLNFFDGNFDSDGGSAPDLFVAGLEYAITTAFMDKNLFDSFRSANFPLSGRGFINNLSGGFGLFGSLVAQPNDLRVVGDMDDPREGFYDVAGTVDGQPVRLQLELYVGRQWNERDLWSPLGAFASGNWVEGPFDRSITGLFGPDEVVSIFISRDDPNEGCGGWNITGPWSPTGPMVLNVFGCVGNQAVGTLNASRRP